MLKHKTMDTGSEQHWKNHHKKAGLTIKDIGTHEDKLVSKPIKYPMRGTAKYFILGSLLNDPSQCAKLSERLCALMSVDPFGYWVFYALKEFALKDKEHTLHLLEDLKEPLSPPASNFYSEFKGWFIDDELHVKHIQTVNKMLQIHAENILSIYKELK